MSEPFYIAQTGECYTRNQAQDWIKKRSAEAQADGAQLIRVSQDPHYENILLIEAWKEKHVADQGHPRWQMTGAA